VLASVDACATLCKTVDDDPSPPSHCVVLAVGTTGDDVEVSVSSIVRTKQALLHSYPRSPSKTARLERGNKIESIFDSVGQPKNRSILDVPKHKTEGIPRSLSSFEGPVIKGRVEGFL
jgi:hypothetical protein